MKPNTSDRTVMSTVGGEAVGMAIAEGAEKHLMGLLTNLYEDPEMAVIREYSTNGYDSHIEAGTKRPIEVSLPTAMRPFLSIRDYGVGLDEEGIRSIYSQYGASTKRDSNDAVGTFGLGCKSALAYADQFTLTAWKAGKRISVSVSRDEHGAGVMTILEPAAPDDGEQGVEVMIPVRRANEMGAKAQQFFRFWEPGTVLVNGKPPVTPQMYMLTPDIGIMTEEGDTRYRYRIVNTTPIIIMGNVPYEHDLDDLSLPYRKRLVARVSIGSCDVAPAREGLMDTGHTRKTLEALVARVDTERQGAAQRELDKARDRNDAVKRAIEACDSLGLSGKGLTFKGEEVPRSIERAVADGKDNRFWHVGKQVSTYSGRGENPADRLRTLTLTEAIRCEAWVVNFTNASWSRAMRTKLDHYVTDHGLCDKDANGYQRRPEGDRTYGLVPDGTVPHAKWFGPRLIDWNVVKAWKDPNRPKAAVGPGVKTAGTYPVHDLNGSWDRMFDADSIDTDKEIVWTIQRPGEGGYQRRSLVDLGVSDFYLVELNATRLPKFKRDFPTAREYNLVLSEAKDALKDSLTQDERDAIVTWAATRVYEWPVTLPDDTDDAEFNRLVKLRKVWNDTAQTKWRHFSTIMEVGGTKPRTTPEAMLDCYPLLRVTYSSDSAKLTAHRKAYVNAIKGGSV